MYYTKVYDKYNVLIKTINCINDYQKALRRAIVLSNATNVAYCIIEDDEFNRYGWFENGKKVRENWEPTDEEIDKSVKEMYTGAFGE